MRDYCHYEETHPVQTKQKKKKRRKKPKQTQVHSRANQQDDQQKSLTSQAEGEFKNHELQSSDVRPQPSQVESQLKHQELQSTDPKAVTDQDDSELKNNELQNNAQKAVSSQAESELEDQELQSTDTEQMQRPISKQHNGPMTIDELPPELLVKIYGNLPLQDLVNAEGACRSWRGLLTDAKVLACCCLAFKGLQAVSSASQCTVKPPAWGAACRSLR